MFESRTKNDLLLNCPTCNSLFDNYKNKPIVVDSICLHKRCLSCLNSNRFCRLCLCKFSFLFYNYLFI